MEPHLMAGIRPEVWRELGDKSHTFVLELFRRTELLLEHAEWPAVPHLSCHEVCEGLALLLPSVKAVHGHFGVVLSTHAWLKVDDRPFIIDAYPWTSLGGPLLVYVATPPWNMLYRPDPAEATPRALRPHVVTAIANYGADYLSRENIPRR